MKTKQDIRKYIKTLFGEQNREKRNIKDIIIEEKVLDYIEKQSVQNICIYENMDDEVDTKVLITKLEEIGKNIYTPQVISETEMILIDKEYEIYEKEIDIFIMPGRAFTKEGERLGRGKGYYDRFLEKKLYKGAKTLGICYDFQILENIPTNNHDIKMNFIISNP